MTSLRHRLGRVVLVLLGGFAAQWFVADRTIVHVGESEMLTRLQHDADSLAAALRVGAQGEAVVDAQRVGLIYGRPYSGHYFVVRGAGLPVVSASFGEARPFEPPDLRGESVGHVDGPLGQPLLVLTRRVDADGGGVVLAVAEDLTAMHGQLALFRLTFLRASVALLAAALALQWREIRRALQPLVAVRDAIRSLPVGGARIDPGSAPDEVRPLLDEIDRLMTAVDQRLQRSRNAIGNLSHALKTPLAGLFRLIDDPALAARPELQRLLREQAQAIRRRIERELKRARLSGERGAGAGFDADEEMPALVELLARIHGGKAVAVQWRGPGHGVAFDREDMLELIGTLADNAFAWARQRVLIEIRNDAGLQVVVADDGPGCPDEMLESLGKRGQRADETRPGHGLGLAIVRDIVESAGGRLEFGRSQALGGLEVVARFACKGGEPRRLVPAAAGV